MTSTHHLFARLEKQRSDIVQGFLWVLLGIVVTAIVLNVLLLGLAVFNLNALAPNLLFIGLIGLTLWLNRQQQFRTAIGLINAVVLFGAALPLLLVGLPGNEISLLLLFLPLVMAGLLLERRGLYLTAGAAGLMVMLAPVLQGATFALGGSDVRDPSWGIAIQALLILAAVTFFLDRFGTTFQNVLRTAVENEFEARQATQERLEAKEELLEERRYNDTILEHLPGIFYVLGENGTYFKWNRNFAGVLGYTDEELTQLQPADLFAGEERALVERRIGQVFDTGYASVEASVVTKDGKRIAHFLNGARVTLGGETYLAGIGIDRSELDAARTRIHDLNEELAERLERITALHEIDKAITGALDLGRTLDVVLEQVTKRLRVDAASILLFSPGSTTLQRGAAHGLRHSTVRATNLRLGEGLAGRVAATRERLVITGAANLRSSLARTSVADEEEFEMYVGMPLVAKGKLQGVLEVFHRTPFTPTEEWTSFLVALGTQAAIALENRALVEDLERRNIELRLAYDTTIEGWAHALDLRDEETEGHSRRVTDLTVQLAQRMGISEEDLVHVRRGALLHDIGKMGVPDGILLKPDKLDEDEWVVMKKHTTFAQQLLAPIPFLRDALDIPYAHHEKWDGSGYPRGLKGEEIPPSARMFAIVDVFDALTSNRPYRKAWSVEKALAHIQEQSGTHFEPSVVEAFMSMIEECQATLPN